MLFTVGTCKRSFCFNCNERKKTVKEKNIIVIIMILIIITLIIIIIKNKIFRTKFSSYDRSIMGSGFK